MRAPSFTRRSLLVLTLSLGTTPPLVDAVWAADEPHQIGMFTTVQGTVQVKHAEASTMIPAVLFERVLFHDVIETKAESKTKALFDDDSMLTVGENSRVEITEHIYNPERSIRRVVVMLIRGSVRALVSRMFTGEGSKFEVHTPSAVAAARGTYFVVWLAGDQTGVANIGSHGRVDFTSGGETVPLHPFQYSTAGPGMSPVQAAVFAANSPAAIRTAVLSTHVEDLVAEHPAADTIQALSGSALPVPAAASRAGLGRGKAHAAGQTGASPGLAKTAPGHTDHTPNQGDWMPPGLAGTTPGQSGMTPGKSGLSPVPPLTISAGAELPPGLLGGGPGNSKAKGKGQGGPPCGTPPCGKALGKNK